MPFEKTLRSLPAAAKNAKATARQGLTALRGDITILIYPLFVFLLVLASLTVVNELISSATNSVAQESMLESDQGFIQEISAIASFLLFYAYLSIMSGGFTCVVAASIKAELDGHKTPLLKGIKTVLYNLPRVVRFSVLSILFIPLGFFAQRSKWHKKPHDVIGSSFSLNMAQMAPAILSSKKGVLDTIRTSVNVMGVAWKENTIIKGFMYGVIILLGAISFLPAYLESHWFNKASADEVSWAISIILFLSLLIATKVLISVFTATLYWRVTNKK